MVVQVSISDSRLNLSLSHSPAVPPFPLLLPLPFHYHFDHYFATFHFSTALHWHCCCLSSAVGSSHTVIWHNSRRRRQKLLMRFIVCLCVCVKPVFLRLRLLKLGDSLSVLLLLLLLRVCFVHRHHFSVTTAGAMNLSFTTALLPPSLISSLHSVAADVSYFQWPLRLQLRRKELLNNKKKYLIARQFQSPSPEVVEVPVPLDTAQ